MAGKKSREKGKRLEREACNFWHLSGWEGACRTAQHRGSADSADLEHTKPFHVEVKGGKKTPDVYAAIKQATKDCGLDAYPVVQLKRDREEWLFVLPEYTMEYLLTYYQVAKEMLDA